jgi:GTP-binding protein LepA
LLHMEIVQERLEREYNLDLITTAPSVIYRVTLLDDSVVEIDNPSTLPSPQERQSIAEPYVRVDMIVPEEFVGALMGAVPKPPGRLSGHEVHGPGTHLLNL